MVETYIDENNVTWSYESMHPCPYASFYLGESTSFKANLIVVGIVNFVTLIPIIILNCLVIGAFIRKATLRKNGNIVLLSLSFTDVLSGLIAQPFFVIIIVIALVKHPKDIPCLLLTLSAVIGYLLACVSLVTVSVISLERYLAIFHPYFYQIRVNTRLLYIICIIIWVVSIPLVVVIYINDDTYRLFLWSNIILISFTYVWNIFVYVRITRKVHELQREMTRIRSRFDVNSSKENNSKAAKVAGSIIVGLLLCYLPQICTNIWSAFSDDVILNEYLMFWSATFALLNPGLNPVFYCYYNSNMRKEIFRYFNWKKGSDISPESNQFKRQSTKLADNTLEKHRMTSFHAYDK